MKNSNLLICIMCFTRCFSQTGINTATPDPNSDLTLGSTNKGLLLNRIPLISTNTGVYNEGMFVYNTATANDVSPGVYISNGTVWSKLIDSQTNFVGTNNSQPLLFKTNGVEKIRIDVDGKIGNRYANSSGNC
ncbi:hypothetical protein ACQWU4_03675 [Chryseobacterium sp. MIQD13]|uniref:hypothetical protein n=1 Tax=Chryseobacterium sp. MIQD13 TaxID=3422310 RepID=UPI003D2CE870